MNTLSSFFLAHVQQSLLLFLLLWHTYLMHYWVLVCTYADECSNKLWTYAMPRAAAQTHRVMWCSRSARTLNLPLGYDKEQTSPLASLEARWPAEQASRNEQRFALFTRECISMATLVCAHGTTILTNCEPSELVEEWIFCALKVRIRTILENCCSEKYFSLYNSVIHATPTAHPLTFSYSWLYNYFRIGLFQKIRIHPCWWNKLRL